MAMSNCRECGASVSDQARRCPSCGASNPDLARHYGVIGIILAITFMVFYVGAKVVSDAKDSEKSGPAPAPKCEMTSNQVTPDIFVINGQPDAGYRVDINAKNNGFAGLVEVIATLSTSEGEYTRTQKVFLDPGQEFAFSFAFNEPSVNAQGIQASASCRP